MIPPEFHGEHFAPLGSVHERIDWDVPTPRTDRVRVRRHTCCCRNVQYEFCEAGGLAFIRRLEFSSGDVAIHETERLLTLKAAHLWELLLRGNAR